jgi:hypothetical protein
MGSPFSMSYGKYGMRHYHYISIHLTRDMIIVLFGDVLLICIGSSASEIW